MARDGALSEKIEDVLVWLATEYLDACMIANNDSGRELLEEQIFEAFSFFQTQLIPGN